MTDIPSAVIILGVFLGILALSRLRVPIGIAVLIGAVSLGFLAGRSFGQVLVDFHNVVTGSYLWLLLAVTASAAGLGKRMCEGRNADAIISMARRCGGRHGRIWSLAAMPAIIGLVPMPAGALFSAPMVQQAVSEECWDASWKVAVNYWFRHVWEYWWPVYPGVIVAVGMFHMETWRYMLAMIAFTPMTIAVGYWFLLRPRRSWLEACGGDRRGSVSSEIMVMLPLALMMACALLLPSLLARLTPGMDDQTRKLLAMLAGMALALCVILRDGGREGSKNILSAMISSTTMKMLLTVGSVVLFQEMLKSSNLLPAAGRELAGCGIPLLLVVAFLPMLAGLVTGLAVGFTGIAFPLVVGLMDAEWSTLTPMATLVLAFGAGYAGYMMSPVHLCLLMTCDFFSASLLRVYRNIFPCVCAMLGFTFLLFRAFHAIGW